ncbi:MAG: hypothetical protein IPM64_17995 [Phycisphaerales bacterium]|nr:hypothetical protein [Phycisphaerales bacterium]
MVLRPVIENNSPIPGLAREFARLRKQALRDTAEFWHEKLLRPHFGPSNRARFGHEAREPFYLQEIKRGLGRGQGKFVDDILTGRSMRFMLAFFTITGTSNAATLTMKPPGYFKNPFEGTFRAADGSTKRISGQPDKAAEVTTVDSRDAQSLSEFHAKRLEALIHAARRTSTKQLT